ncbi:pilus assembly protein [Falsibacillus albus]|uniref:Pilus assembly protein n=1 Tax=Falsibacillus albus TaxID=2478915 RepID=A0A3L7JLH7_9BACI|nr:pilus assembly protein [Falsibacillus albus]RLQ91155.1 pilus assembly protein [Falsibacillus albus]
MLLKKIIKNEKGALSFEFLGILPFFFLFFLLLWQVVASGYAVFTAKSAVNDAAKVLAASNDLEQAKETAIEAIGDSSVLQYKKIEVTPLNSTGKFKLTLYTENMLVFIPDKWKPSSSLSLTQSATGQVLVP